MHATTTTDKAQFKSAARVNHALTARLEKQVLEWMARHAPRWVTSDQLTVLGFGAQIAAGIFYALAPVNRLALPMVIVCVSLNWLGDSLDGTLARVRGQQRPRYGFYVDHMADVFGAVALVCGMGCSGFLHWPVAIAMLIGFLVLSSESYLAAYTLTRFELSKSVFGPTEIRILLVIGNLALLRSPYCIIPGHRVLLFDAGGTAAAGIMFSMGIAVTLRHIVQLYREEPLP